MKIHRGVHASMSRNRWRYLFAVVGLVAPSIALAQNALREGPVDQQPAQKQLAITPDPQERAVPPTDADRGKHDDKSAEDSAKDAETDDDLILGDGWAQWVMASTGIVALLLSAWAVWLLDRTLRATRAAVTQTEAATAAALAANKTTREIGEAQTRAYLFSEGVKCEPLGTSEAKNCDVIILSGDTKNFGSSPAKNISMKLGAMCHLSGTEAIGIRLDDLAVGMTCSPQGYLSFAAPIEFPIGAIEQIRSMKRELTAIMIVSYTDVFGKEEASTTVLKIQGAMVDGGLMHIVQPS